ncbi:MAG: energy transducer TonB [candidate division Zixibacteria bacterium]|nr:energy transducer TonB [candidate division Zixibacteria bacterium]
MKSLCPKKVAATLAAGLVFAFAVSTIMVGPAVAGNLYATAISGGKTRPVIDIDNKLTAPARQAAVRELKVEPWKKRDSVSSRKVVEEAARYRLHIDPTYPRRARLANKEATLELELTFDENGKMKDALVNSCDRPGWGFEQAILAAALEATLAGHGQREITVRTKIKFKLE